MARAGDSSLRISRNQSSVLRGAHRAALRKGSAITETRDLPSWERLFSGGHPREAKHRYNHGIHTARRSDDGNTIWLYRSWDNDLLDPAEWLHRTATRRAVKHKIRPVRNLWHLERHAADRGSYERRPSSG